MASTPRQRSDHISQVRQATREIICSIDKLARLNRQWTRQKLAPDFSDADFVGENEGLKKSDITHVYDTLTVIDTALSANNNEHWQNLYVFLTTIC